MKTINLSAFRRNDFSQCGEDSLIEKLFELAGINSGFLIEAGAWDGVRLSNTYYHATKNPAFKRLLIECDKDRFFEMTQLIPWNENNILLNLKIETEGENSLNAVFEKYIKEQFIALISVDVDGEDMNLWESLDTKTYRPAIVIIENGSWKAPISLTRMVQSFDKRGYNLVHVTGNFVFMDAKYGIKATETIHKLIRKSGNPEYDLYFGKITQEEYDERVPKLPGTDFYLTWAGEQLVEVPE